MTPAWDYVIVGAGSAGAALAGRLSEDPDRPVLLIEAGGRDWSPQIHVPGLLEQLLGSQGLNWRYEGEPDPSLDHRRLTWADGVEVLGPTPIDVGDAAELLHVRMDAAQFFPARIQLLERHSKHTQTYLSANGRPFVMVLGAQTLDGLPDASGLRAFVFRDGAGVVMAPGVWHEFPLALEDDTRFTVILSSESHVDQLTDKPHPNDARGPDLERYDMAARAALFVEF